jgi:hypothetical protein
VEIAVDKGFIKYANQPLLEFFPEKTIANLDGRKRAITLKHLLMMASGLETRDSYLYGWLGLFYMPSSTDWAQYVLDRQMTDAPESKSCYPPAKNGGKLDGWLLDCPRVRSERPRRL